MKQKSKVLKTVAALVLSGSFFYGPVQAAGIPTYDAAGVAQAMKQVVHMKEQIDNQINQINQLKSQVKAMTGTRNLGNILKNTVKDQVPDEWASIYNSGVTLTQKNSVASNKYIPNASQDNLLKVFDLSQKTFKDTKKRLDNIDGLMRQIDLAQDMKAAADLQNRIAIERGVIQQQQIKLDMMARTYQLQQEIESERGKAYAKCIAQHVRDRNFAACQ